MTLQLLISRTSLAAAAVATLLLIFTGTAAAAVVGTSAKCTINGTKGPDKLVGTKGRDVICGFRGNDLLLGRGGSDLLRGGPGNDRLLAHQGADRVDGNSGDDVARGGAGNDSLFGSTGNDKLLGEPQNDFLSGGPGDDFLDGGSGVNRIDGGSGTNRCLATAADTLAGTCDSSPPVISDVVVSPTSIDTWEEEQFVTVTWRVTDDRTGIALNNQSLTAHHEATNQFNYGGAHVYTWPQQTGGDVHNATYEAIFRVPRYSPQGPWSLDFQSSDQAGNRVRLEKPELLKMGMPTGFVQTGKGDDTDPVISGFSIDRTSVDTSSSSQIVHLRARVTDTISGVNLETTNGVYGGAGLEGSQQTVGDTCDRLSGDKYDGIYECTLVFPRYAAQGNWSYGMGARDFAENSTSFGDPQKQASGLPKFITQTAPGDTTAPKLVEFSISPTRVDTTDGPREVNFHIRMTDDLSGLAFESGFSIPLAVNGAQSPLQADLVKVAGGPLDSTFEGSVTLPQGSVHGSWTPQFIVTMDQINNYEMLGLEDLTKLGFPTTFINGS